MRRYTQIIIDTIERGKKKRESARVLNDTKKKCNRGEKKEVRKASLDDFP